MGVEDDVEQFFTESSQQVAEIARAARRLVLDMRPDAVEALDPGNRIVGYSTGPRAMKDMWVGIAPHAHHVNLQLANGALINDPAEIVEGTGKRVRHVTLRSTEDVNLPEVCDALQRSLDRHLAESS